MAENGKLFEGVAQAMVQGKDNHQWTTSYHTRPRHCIDAIDYPKKEKTTITIFNRGIYSPDGHYLIRGRKGDHTALVERRQ